MFCPKCGTKALEGAGFCQKCGAKLIVDDSAAQPAVESPANSTNQSASAPKEAPAKKKSKKLPIIIGVAALVVLVVIFIAMNWEGKTDYEATVRAYAPFANSQGLPYTYGKVFDKYIPNAKWEVRKSDDAVHVDISGKAKGTDAEMVITIKVSPDEKDPDLALISPESVSVSGNKSPTEDEAVRFLLAMFIAYDEGDEDLSNFSDRLDEVGLTTQGDVNLTETFTDADSGISFQYPAGWAILDSPSEFKIVEMLDSQNTADHVATLNVDLIFDQDPYGVFTQDEAAIQKAVNEYHTFIDFEDTLIGGIPAKALKYQTQQMNRDDVVVSLWYKIGENVYQVRCIYTASDANRYEPVFEAIMNSYAIAATDDHASANSEMQKAYAEKVRELASENDNLQFSLIDLTKNDAPELVADLPGYYISIFSWENGEVYSLGEDQWPYGAGGNNGYEYLPGENLIRNFNSDYAGAVVYESYYGINFAHELSALPSDQLSVWYFRDTNGNGYPDENEPFLEDPIYYVGDNEVSKDVYASHQVSGDYQWISGEKTESEMLALLDNFNESLRGEGIAANENHDLTFRGISLTDWIGGPADIAYDVFGWPDYGTIIDDTLYSGGEYFGYNVGYNSGISFIIDYQTDKIGWITGAAEAIEVNGVTLDMTRTKLIDLFGTPESEEAVSDELAGSEYYVMRYTIKGFPVEISMPNKDSAATAVMISQNSY